jgi:2-polyprenyl-6-methoxyphenol hydroxylase-like FAD-dependent oxidoreductase
VPSAIERPVIVVGSGIAGLTFAASLRRSGREGVVLERGKDLPELGAGISLWPNALAALDTIDLGDQVRRAGGPVASGGIRRPDGSWIRRMDRTVVDGALGEPLVAVHRSDLLAILADAVGRSDIRFGVAVRSFERIGGGVAVHLDDGSRIEGCALVGADGVGSVVAMQMHPGLTSTYSGYTAWRGVAAIDVSGLDPGETWGTGHEFGFLPLGRDRAYWFATMNTPEGGRAEQSEHHLLTETFGTWHEPIPALMEATDPGTILRHDIYDRTPLTEWADGRAVVIGDAAHPMRPHLGQGGCQAIEDGVLLGDVVRDQTDLESAFAGFSRSRQQRTRRIAHQSKLLGRAIQSEGLLGRAARMVGARLPERMLVRNMAQIGGRAGFTGPVHG